MLLSVSVKVRLLVSLIVFELAGTPTRELANIRFVGLRATGATPVPVRGTVCVPVPALSVSVSVPVRIPVTAGVKVALILQLPLGGSEPGQRLLVAKSPLAVTPAMTKTAVPELVRVTLF
jgi:hypothetical protein